MAKQYRTESKEDYLEKILMLEEKEGEGRVHAVDLAKALSFSKPSVSIALKKLKADGYIITNERDEISLTPEGRKVAEEVYEKHKVLGKFFSSWGVPEDIAYKDACRIEHVISDETYAAIKEHYEKTAGK
jgi:Mn-dependent DtxR family transcriptional regulator